MKLTIYDNLKQIITQLVKKFNLNILPAPTGRPRKISKLDSLTLAVYRHTSTRACDKVRVRWF